MIPVRRIFASVVACFVAIQPLNAANGGLVLSQLVVDLRPGTHSREDIELKNEGSDRMYVAVEPALITDPGGPSQSRTENPDPEQLGLLATPARLILEPGERRLLRIAAIGPAPATEHVYRVTVKPVAGPVESTASGLKILVGYDMLVLVRPAVPRPSVTGSRNGRTLLVRNDGNSSVELLDGKQCDATGKQCASLPGKRLYAGAQWSEALNSDGPVEYRVRSAVGEDRQRF